MVNLVEPLELSGWSFVNIYGNRGGLNERKNKQTNIQAPPSYPLETLPAKTFAGKVKSKKKNKIK